jgi:mannitol/fructose-specific phosphotransferase system IIA component (Ntr-type)
VAPEGSASIHLKVLARIAKMLKNAGFRKSLMQASTREELYKTITRNDEEF